MSTTATTLTRWEHVQLARHPGRPHALTCVRGLCTDFVELHGDRRFGDDPAIVTGLACFDGRTVAVLGQQKGSNSKENIRCNFGCLHPEGYRKALRVMRHAEKFGFPLLCLIDTPGASPDMESEERGQGMAIAENLIAMAGLRVPIIATVLGEGGSGGALAIGVADRLLMLEYAIYSVASPEAGAAILWHDAAQAADAAEAMKVTAADLHALGVADEVVPEVAGGAHLDPARTIADLGVALRRHLGELVEIPPAELLRCRHDKYRAIGLTITRQEYRIEVA
jgi:acetyl-CoA carboxylase carboxyl transferase subunit alpha